MAKKTIEEKKAVKSAYNKMYAKKRVFTPEQKEAARLYNLKRYHADPNINKANCIKQKEKRATQTIEQKRDKFILNGKPIPPRYMNEAELSAHKEADKERRRMAEMKRLANKDYRERKRMVDRHRMSDEGTRKRKRMLDSERSKDWGSSLKGRARRVGAYIENVDVVKVYDRDKWKCVLCGCKVVKSRDYKSNRATIDHRIPLSKGGSHTYDNCQTMCTVCNSSKHTKVLGSVQLSVFDRVE